MESVKGNGALHPFPCLLTRTKGTAMARTIDEYRRRWVAATGPDVSGTPWDEPLTPTACITYESARSTPMAEGCNHFPDFGDAICFYRFLHIPEELATTADEVADLGDLLRNFAVLESTWKRYRSRFSDDALRYRRAEGERALDALLERFVRQGYQAAMGQRLIEIVNATLIDFELHEVYILPEDLGTLLERFGNPLADYEAYEDAATAEAAAPDFDLGNSGHRAALAKRLAEIGR
jgi:hypothetical protein